VKTITRSSQSRTYYVSKLWLSVATATVVFLISVGALLFTLRPLSRFQSKYFVRVVDAATNAPISNGEVELSFGAAPQRMITDFNGTATFVLSDKEIGKTGTVRAEFYGYEPQQQPFDVTRHGNRTIFLPLTRETKPRDAQPPSSFAQVFSSGMVPSGQGGDFSVWYEVVADPPPQGYVIDFANSSYSLAGDRKCDAWAECGWGDRTASKVSFHFRLQGHSEYPAPGVGMSQGFLRVVYKPK
jgi:hypothetical protein